MKKNKYSSIESIILTSKKGGMYILVDDENRENEGDLVIPASNVSAKNVNFMAKNGRGLICLSLTNKQSKKLNLPLMSPINRSRNQTAFTISIEARKGVTTGISAKDRSVTIKTAINTKVKKKDIVSPGHIFPIISKEGGVLVRAGHTEASVDISQLANKNPSAVICEIMNDKGVMAKGDELFKFAKKHNLKIAKIEDLISYRLKNEKFVKVISNKKINIKKFGFFDLKTFKNKLDGLEHQVITNTNFSHSKTPRVRVISTNILNTVFNLKKNIIRSSLKYLTKYNNFALVLISSSNQNKTLPENNTILRYYGVGAQILKELKIKNMILVSRSKKRIIALRGYGINIKKQEIIK